MSITELVKADTNVAGAAIIRPVTHVAEITISVFKHYADNILVDGPPHFN